MRKLEQILRRIDGRGYPAYKDIRGSYSFPEFDLDVIYVQGDPFASPSRFAIRLGLEEVGLNPKKIANPSRRLGAEDALLRSFASCLPKAERRGSGKSGQWGIVGLGQEMFARTACEIYDGEICIRFTAGLPAQGRRVLGRQAADMLLKDLPAAVVKGLRKISARKVYEAADANEDQDVLRGMLAENGLVAFIANGSILPRQSGIDDRALREGAVPWQSPAEREVSFVLPNAGEVKGTGIKRGVTLICGGGYHGKSTVLRALARGVYNHIPGDGRELCVSVGDAVQVRAEDGRSISGVDISGFIGDLPDGRNTENFDSTNASGSTSQAASIVEALEIGSRCLLIDEDTSATNFMVRDRRMQELIATDREPITPFVDRVAELSENLEVSTVLVVGGCGDYFAEADDVMVMESYLPQMATEKAKEIAEAHPSNRLEEVRSPFGAARGRVPVPASISSQNGNKERAMARDTRAIQFGEEEIDTSLLSQLVDDGQARTIADWMVLCKDKFDGKKRTLREVCEWIERESQEHGLSATTRDGYGDRVIARRFELAATLNRLRSLKVK